MAFATSPKNEQELKSKIFWVIILLLSIAGCLYMIYEVLEKYENSPVVVSFATEDTPIHQIPFPAVTICPEAKYSGKKFNYSHMYYKVKNGELDDVSEADLRHFYHLSVLCLGTEEVATSANKIMDSEFFDAIDELKPDPGMFDICIFVGNESAKCEGFFTPVIIDEGICYSFNILDRFDVFEDHVFHYKNYYHTPNSQNQFNLESGYSKGAGVHTYPRRALMSGAKNALEVFFGFEESDTDYICNSYLQGWRVLIHSPYDVPRLSQNYFRVPFDKVVVAAIEPEVVTTSMKVKRFDPEKRKCYMMDERPLQYFKVYTQPNCLLECLTNYTYIKCDCVPFYMPHTNQTKTCGSGSAHCVAQAEKELKIKDLEVQFSSSFSSSDTFCDCKPSCSNLKFSVETSHSTFYFEEYFQANHDLSYLLQQNRNHWAILSVYFKDEQFMPVERNELYGMSDLISNLGGLVGLFTGFSIITMIEIIYFLSLRLCCNRVMYGTWAGPTRL